MKYFTKLILLIITVIPFTVLAVGTASISGASTVENGSYVTIKVTLKNMAAWNIKISGTGSTSNCFKAEADATADGKNATKTFSLSCLATNEGTINFTVTGDMTSTDEVTSKVNLTKSVTVTKKRERESESRLSLLSVDGYAITFDKDTKVYNLDVEPNVNSINIKATAISKYATVTGAGIKELTSDYTTFTITCTSETGEVSEYTLNVSIKDSNPIKVTINNEEYTVVKNAKNSVAPENYIEKKININDYAVTAYANETTKITLVNVKDKNGNMKYAIYDNNNYTLYNENKSNNLTLFITFKELDGYNLTDITINEETYKGYKLTDRFVLVYAMNVLTGEYNYYKYDNVDKTFQYYEIKDSKESTKKESNINIVEIVMGLALVGTIGYIFYLKSRHHR